MLLTPFNKKSFSSLLDLRPFSFRLKLHTSTSSSTPNSKISTPSTPSSSYPSSREPSIHLPNAISAPTIPNKPPQTIFERRVAARINHNSSALRLQGYPDIFPNSASITPEEINVDEKSGDRECWERMLELQRRYHCYNSARLEAAVEALEQGWGIEKVPMPSRLCLDLLNDELRARVESHQIGISPSS